MEKEPPRPLKGRGALSNPANRYQPNKTEAFDDGWNRVEDRIEHRDRPKTVFLEESSRTIISSNKSPDIPFDYSINPYQGCEHGCIYCYARPSHAFWDMSPGLDFETKIVIKPNAAELLREKLSNPRYRIKPLCIGANTDPYQPAESQRRITRSIIEVLSEFRHPFSIISKSNLILRDLDLLVPLAESNLCTVSISVTTLDNGLKRILEPRTPSGLTRLRAIEELSRSGIDVTLLTAPMIPYINDHELESILHKGRDAGAVSSRYILLRLPLEISEMFREWLIAHFPDRAARVINAIRQSHGGSDYRSVFFERMTGRGEFASLIHNRWSVTSRKLGFQNDDNRFQLDYSLFNGGNQQLSLF